MTCHQEKDKIRNSGICALSKCVVKSTPLFDYHRNLQTKGVAFVWLDEVLNAPDNNLNQIIEPYQWCFFNNISQCISYIEYQIRQKSEIFLVTSGALGYELFLTAYHFMAAIQFVYVYCSRLGLHEDWTRYYSQIQGVFNDSLALQKKIKQNLEQVDRSRINDDIGQQLPTIADVSGQNSFMKFA